MYQKYKSLFFALLILLSVGGSKSFAQSIDECKSSPNTPYTFNLSSIAVQKSLPVGADIPGTEKTISFSGHCDHDITYGSLGPIAPGDLIVACYYGIGDELPGLRGVYSTGVPGVGIALENSNGQRIYGEGVRCDTRNSPLGTINSDYSFSYSVRLALVKTSDTVSPGLLQQTQTQFGMGVYNKSAIGGDGGINQNYVAYTGNVTVRIETCSVNNPVINIPLGDHGIIDFPQVGSVSTSKSFSINLTCDESADVNIRINGDAITSAPGVIALQKSGQNTAEGVGVQILNSAGEPIEIGSIWQVINYAQQGSLQIPLSGRYYRIGDMKEGDANAVATFTMIYY